MYLSSNNNSIRVFLTIDGAAWAEARGNDKSYSLICKVPRLNTITYDLYYIETFSNVIIIMFNTITLAIYSFYIL